MFQDRFGRYGPFPPDLETGCPNGGRAPAPRRRRRRRALRRLLAHLLRRGRRRRRTYVRYDRPIAPLDLPHVVALVQLAPRLAALGGEPVQLPQVLLEAAR